MTALAPDPAISDAIPNWAQTEAAKRWVIDNLGRWHWFRPENPGAPPVFHMLAEGGMPVPMGHGDDQRGGCRAAHHSQRGVG